ncbi:MAG: helix-turn-helix domain-containing protein [Syntrophomonadaceae bacterium]|nr:helix-turn-helix domain-containing protein [Syntrophomonadaceae bacterium]
MTAAGHLFSLQGIDSTTMEQIAAEADVAKGTLYSHFPAKEAIIESLVQQRFRDRHQLRLDRLHNLPDTRARLVLVLGELMEGVRSQPDLFEKYLASRIRTVVSLRPQESTGSGLRLLAAEIIRLGQRGGEVRTDLPDELLCDLFEFVFVEAAKPFYLAPGEFDAAASISRSADLFLRATRPDPAGSD